MKKKFDTQKEEDELRANPINVFMCDVCKGLKAMNHTDFMKHLTDEHKLEKGQMSGTRQMIMHIDGDYWFSYDYKITLNSGLVFFNHTKYARSKNDPMRF